MHRLLRHAARAALPFLALFCAAHAAVSAGLGFSDSVSATLVEVMTRRFGPPVRERLAAWQRFMRAEPRIDSLADLGGKRLPAALTSVNLRFNRVPFVADEVHWRVEDYWATPVEMFSSNGGDCEDFSIAKYYALKELGIPVNRLRIVYVKATRLNQAHMVLAYYPEPDAEPFILDNLEQQVSRASERPDLVPVYSFNDEDVRIVRAGGATPSAGSASQIRLWRELQQKLEREART